MATLIFAMNQSLDGFVDHDRFAPDSVLFRHFVDDVAALTGSIYGRRMYGFMRYWDDDQEDWNQPERDYAAAWRVMPKWVVSRTLGEVGPNATLISEDVEDSVRALKERLDGEVEVAGPVLARTLGEAGLIDEYHIYLHPAVLGDGRPYFNGWRPELRLDSSERIGENAIKLVYLPNRDTGVVGEVG